VLQSAVRRAEPVAFSAITLLELAVLTTERKLSLTVPLHELFDELQCDPVFHLLPLTFEIASEVVALRALRDPSDRVIVATARVHHLQLVTSDQRIIESKLVPVIE